MFVSCTYATVGEQKFDVLPSRSNNACFIILDLFMNTFYFFLVFTMEVLTLVILNGNMAFKIGSSSLLIVPALSFVVITLMVFHIFCDHEEYMASISLPMVEKWTTYDYKEEMEPLNKKKK